MEEIRVIIGFRSLQHAGHSFQPHAGVNVLVRKFAVLAPLLPRFRIILAENNVPNLNVTVIFDVFFNEFDATGTIFRTPVIKNFRAGTARTFPDFPKILLEFKNMVFRNPEFHPNLLRCQVAGVDCKIEAVQIEREPTGRSEDLNRPSQSFFPEIIPDREIPQHLKKCVVPRRETDIFNVIGAERFLHIRHSGIGRDFPAVKNFFRGATPALIQSKLGSFCGMREALGMMSWPLLFQKSSHMFLISLLVNFITIYSFLFDSTSIKDTMMIGFLWVNFKTLS